MNKEDEVLNKLQAFSKKFDSSDEIELTESIVLNGDQFIPKGSTLEIIKE